MLIATNVGIVLAALAVGFAGSLALFRSLADQQAIARALQAGQAASSALDHSGDEVLVAAQLLAERPTLARLLASGDASGLEAFLDRFRATSRLDGCMVVSRGAVFARSGLDLSAMARHEAREDLAARGDAEGALAGGAGSSHPSEAGEAAVLPGSQPVKQLVSAGAGGALLLLARAPVPGDAATEVLTARSIDDALVREIGLAAGAATLVLDASHAGAEIEAGDRGSLRAVVLATETVHADRVREDGSFVCALPLRTASGGLAGILEVVLPASDAEASLGRFAGQLLVLGVTLALLAALASYLLASRLVGPLQSLSEASHRIGRGELGTPIPRAGVAEVGRLAVTMEEMQGRLLRLLEAERARQAEAEAVLGGIVEGVFVVDRERRIRYLNPQTARLLGISATDAIGRFCGDVLRPVGRGGARPCEESCPILDARFGRSAHASETLVLQDGRRRTVVVTSAAPARSSPATGGGIADSRQFQMLRDETELEATRRLRDTVLANISHEFRTPLSAQIASIELLLDRLPELSQAEIRRLLVSLERGANRLTHLIDNLLESVRIDAGRDSIRRQPVLIDEVIEAAVAMTGYLMEQRDQKIEIDLPHPSPEVAGDAPRLTQVFVNLLANANKFAPQGSTIRIGGVAAGREIQLWVEDEGPGLPKGEPVASIFGRFVRSPGEEPAESGMGLGLSIVRSIVERHGGRVAAGEGAGGRGTRISLWLPVGAPTGVSPHQLSRADAPGSPSGRSAPGDGAAASSAARSASHEAASSESATGDRVPREGAPHEGSPSDGTLGNRARAGDAPPRTGGSS